MRFKISLPITALCLLISSLVLAQDNAKLIPFFDSWPFMQDRQGYIWYSEGSGRVGRFVDGDRSNDADIFDEFSGCDYTNLIQEDVKGHIWISTGCRFYRYDPVKEKFEDIQQQIFTQTEHTQAHTESWYEDTSGTVWFGGSALISYTLASKKIIVHDKNPQGYFLYNLFGGTGHSVWFSGDVKKRGFNFNQYDPLKRKVIRTLTFDFSKLGIASFMSALVKTEKIFGGKRETYLVYLGARVFEFDPGAGTLINIPLPVEFGKANQIGNDGLHNYIGTNEGAILLYRPNTHKVELVWKHVAKKPVENIFAASKGNGAFASIDNNLIPISTSPPLLKSILDLTDSSFGIDPEVDFVRILGRHYFIRMNDMISLTHSTKSDTIKFSPPIHTSRTWRYVVGEIEGTSKFWQLVQYHNHMQPYKKPQLFQRDSVGNLLKSFESPLLDSLLFKSVIKELVTDKCNNVWIYTWEGEIMLFHENNTEKFQSIKSASTKGITSPRISVDSKCNLWISDPGIGLIQYNSKNGIYKNYSHVPSDTTSIGTSYITTAFEAANGDIWIGTKNKGISVLNPKTGKFRHLQKQHGLPELIIADIVQDKKGQIWVATLQYLCQWIPKENRFIVYRKQDGVNVSATFVQKVFYPEQNGLMMIRTNKAIMAFNPDEIRSYQYPLPRLFFTGFSVDNKPVTVGSSDSILPKAINFIEKVSLPYALNRFNIRYAAVDFYGNLQYAYRLAGFEDRWQYVNNKTEAIYTNVPPGNYVFEVKAANHQGYWGESRRIPIKIRAPWYRTWLAYIIYVLLFAVLLRMYLRFRSRKLIKQNLKLEDRISKRTNELSVSLKELKETQDQLIQREKMASLGELTAGIAHEIQNPLNFVNNFSEVNKELLGDMRNEIDKGNFKEVAEIAKDIEHNEAKINHHGKRADAIVKGMLQHSRTSSGVKEPTNVNVLADEYLRLAYHGIRAKDKSFNATLNTDFDESIGKIDVVPQEIGRVILNLITNALYEVGEKKRQISNEFDPTVSVSTKKIEAISNENPGHNMILIRVADNGKGIPKKILEKIFQPFFTTKPPGEGTGLGLSLSYDIIKAHGGELKVETKEGEGTAFTIQLPA